MFEGYLKKFNVQADGVPILRHSSHLLPVRMGNTPAMLKVAIEPEEKRGGIFMAWWEGLGAARVFAHDGDAILMERAEGPHSLLDMAMNGKDDEATRILCQTAAQLHAPRNKPLPELIPLQPWFKDLEPGAKKYGGLIAQCAAHARSLLATPQDVCVLHGDIHHANVLDFGTRGWLAIDPKGLIGERGYDYANIFCNPELATTVIPARFERQLEIVIEASGLQRKRLLQWIMAYAGLSAVWFLDDGQAADSALAVAAMASAQLSY